MSSIDPFSRNDRLLMFVVFAVFCLRHLKTSTTVKTLSKFISLQDLVRDLKDEIAGNFEDLAVALLVLGDEYEARCLHNAIAVSKR